jgi:hypothetical protein
LGTDHADLTAGSEVAYEANGASNPQPIRLNCTLTGVH